MGLTLLPGGATGFNGAVHVGKLNTVIEFISLASLSGTETISPVKFQHSILKMCTFYSFFSFSACPQDVNWVLPHFSCKIQTQIGAQPRAMSSNLPAHCSTEPATIPCAVHKGGMMHPVANSQKKKKKKKP